MRLLIITINWLIDCPCRYGYCTPDEGKVLFFHEMLNHLLGNLLMNIGGFGNCQDPRSFLIQSMHRTETARNPCLLPMVHNTIRNGIHVMTMRWMDDDSCILS
ncbi:hypothetical protein D3C85_1640410 [compost metagenome]